MRLIELCCGSAALTRHALGMPDLMPYMGSKGRYVDAIADVIALGRVRDAVLFDVGPWPVALDVLSTEAGRASVLEGIKPYLTGDAREHWERLRKSPVPSDRVQMAVAFLVLQRWSFGATPIKARDGAWACKGFNATDAYGRPASDGFGEVLPMLPSFAQRLHEMLDAPITGIVADVRTVEPADWLTGDDLVYFDPPYRGTTGYGPDDLTRPDVIEIAQRWHAAGAPVVVSEGEPIPIPGWQHVEVTKMRKGKKSTLGSAGKMREWLTISPDVKVYDPARMQLSMWGAG